VPRVLPFVGHRDDVPVVELAPILVAAREALRRRAWLLRIAREPIFHDVVIELLAPEKTCVRLTRDAALRLADGRRNTRCIEFIAFADALGEDVLEFRAIAILRADRFV